MTEMNHKIKSATFFMSAFSVAMITGACLSRTARAAEEVVSYELDVYPIISSRCVECHQPGGDGYQASGLDMSTYEGLMKGTKYGPVIVPGDTLTSNLNVLIEGRAQVQMPHDQRPLLKAQQSIIRDWVKQGAKNN